MSSQPLFFARGDAGKFEIVKEAGYKMPSDPGVWQSEIIRYLKSQHPYLDMSTADIDIRRFDAVKGAAVGSVIIGGSVAIPVIIQRPRPGADPELSPMDVFYSRGRYRFLDPETVKRVIYSPAVGEVEKSRKSRAIGGNPYIGDVTGDATPLEYSGQASPFGGPYDGSKMSADMSDKFLPDYITKEARSLAGSILTRDQNLRLYQAESGRVLSPSNRPWFWDAVPVAMRKRIVFGRRGGLYTADFVIPVSSARGYARLSDAMKNAKRMYEVGPGDRMLLSRDKTAGQETEKERLARRAKSNAATFGITGAVGGAVRGAFTGRGAKGRTTSALKQALVGAVAGTASGASLPYARAAMGVDRREKKVQRQAIRAVVKKELTKNAGLVGAGFFQGLVKNAYIDPNDISRFRRIIVSNPQILQGSADNLRLVEVVTRTQARDRDMIKKPGVTGPNILQVYNDKDRPDVIRIKFSGQPSVVTNEAELKDILGSKYKEVMSRLRSHGVYMEHDGINKATWDVNGAEAKEPRAVMSDGLYSVRMKDGSNLIGLVSQSIMDVEGKTLPLKMFVTQDGKYALSPELYGLRMSSKHRLPSQIPAAGETGTFVNYIYGTPVATMPLLLISKVTVAGEGGKSSRTFYRVQDPMTGKRFALSAVAGVQGFERMRVIEPGVNSAVNGEDVYFMPGDSEWVTLRTPVAVADSVAAMEKLNSLATDVEGLAHITYCGGLWNVEKTAGFMTRGISQIGKLFKNPGKFGKGIKNVYAKGARGDGGVTGGVWNVAKNYAPGAVMAAAPIAGGAVVGGLMSGGGGGGNKVVIAAHDIDEAQGRELLVAMGMDVDGAQSVLDSARDHGGVERGVKVAGLHDPEIQGEDVVYDDSEPGLGPKTAAFVESCRPGVEIIKAAAESGMPETLDALLSLEFITPQNLRYFVDAIDDFDEVASRLAALLISVRLGMPHVGEAPVKESLEGLSKTTNKLRVLKSALDHEKERPATVA